MKILFILIPLFLSLFFNYVQYQRNLDLKERLYETEDWVDPVLLATLDAEERADRRSLLPVYSRSASVLSPVVVKGRPAETEGPYHV